MTVASGVNFDLLVNRGIANEIADAIVRAIRYSDSEFGIGFFEDGTNKVAIRMDGSLKDIGQCRDKLQEIIMNAILESISRIENKPKSSWKELVDEFHKFFYYPLGEYRGYNQLYWFGRLMMKNPMDLMLYQEIIYENMPDVIIETGTAFGASALYLAHLCDLVGKGRVISIDNCIPDVDELSEHERIDYWINDSVKPDLVAGIQEQVQNETVMVILDSDHRKEHVIKELNSYAPMVTKGQYLIVEDTNLNGHPVMTDHGPGPYEALQEWLPSHPEFEVDKHREHFIFSQNHGGYLKKIA